MSPSTPNLLAQYFVLGLRLKLGLDPQSCFPSILPMLDVGWEGDLQIQVTPGSSQPDGGGKGNQAGGALIIRQNFDLTIFYRLNVDPHGRSDQILTENSTGLIDICEKVKNLFKHTFLNNMSIERIAYEGESSTSWIDSDRGLVQRRISFSANYGSDIEGITLTNAELQNQIASDSSP